MDMRSVHTMIPAAEVRLRRQTQIRAIAALIRMDATDLIPILFAPVHENPMKGLRHHDPVQ